VSAKKLAVSTHLQYILTALCALLLFVFVRQLSGVVLLTPLFAAILAALLVLIVSGVGRVQSLEQSPEFLTDKRASGTPWGGRGRTSWDCRMGNHAGRSLIRRPSGD
jgi:hypothetical protein